MTVNCRHYAGWVGIAAAADYAAAPAWVPRTVRPSLFGGADGPDNCSHVAFHMRATMLVHMGVHLVHDYLFCSFVCQGSAARSFVRRCRAQ